MFGHENRCKTDRLSFETVLKFAWRCASAVCYWAKAEFGLVSAVWIQTLNSFQSAWDQLEQFYNRTSILQFFGNSLFWVDELSGEIWNPICRRSCHLLWLHDRLCCDYSFWLLSVIYVSKNTVRWFTHDIRSRAFLLIQCELTVCKFYNLQATQFVAFQSYSTDTKFFRWVQTKFLMERLVSLLL